MKRVAVLDDYQRVAAAMADWGVLAPDAAPDFFHDHIADESRLAEQLKPHEAVCLMRERTLFPRRLMEKLPRLKLLVTAGMANAAIDMAAATERGVVVCGTKAEGRTTAELTWGLILAAVRNIPFEANAMRSGGWQRTLGMGLYGRTLGILGLGRIGPQMAAVAQAFGMKVIAWSQNMTAADAAQAGATLVSKDELLANADVITVHLRLSERTRHLIGAAELARMKPTAYLVNTSRGPIVDERALMDALNNGRIAGAALDVFAEEPLPDAHPLRTTRNLILTPHLGFVTEQTYRAYYGDMVAGIRAWLDGKPERVLNPDVLKN